MSSLAVSRPFCLRNFNTNIGLPDSRDSGYNSFEDSPEVSPRLKPVYLPVFDGSGSEDGSDVSYDENILETPCPKARRRARSCSAPGRIVLEKETVSFSTFLCTNSSPALPSTTRRPRPQTHLSDRYVPKRDPASSPAEKYRTTKQPHDLTPSERILRNQRASLDPFTVRVNRSATPERRPLPRVDGRPLNPVGPVLGAVPQNLITTRQVSQGTIWTVGGLAPNTAAVDDGQGHFLQRGTHARIFTTTFCAVKTSIQDDVEKHEGRIATALELDPARRILEFDSELPFSSVSSQNLFKGNNENKTTWNGYRWVAKEDLHKAPKPAIRRILPAAPFKILDAPGLRDDFYCTTLAYTPTTQTLAVGLGNSLYAWSEDAGTRLIHGAPAQDTWLTSVAFSSNHGARAVLGMGRSDGSVVLKSMHDSLPRFDVQQPYPIACLSWRPTYTMRPSKNPLNPGVSVQTEDLVVGDELGTIYYYVVEWPMGWEVSRDTWPGSMSLVAKINIHSQQICGISWSTDGKLFASGGNDNLCCLFEVDRVLDQSGSICSRPARPNRRRMAPSPMDANLPASLESSYIFMESNGSATDNGIQTIQTSPDSMRNFGPGIEKHCWVHDAAVKAIAFCPWRHGLVATGGGSNDKCIHFFHTSSGAALATISVSAQVTSLIWSTTRREIAATFGYAQPDHPYRIAIFSWPDCRQVAAIPWQDSLRALYAIPYPGSVGGKLSCRAAPEGCIVVASSDKSVKFHEVWSHEKRATIGGSGILAGSDILEGLEGIDKEGEIIR